MKVFLLPAFLFFAASAFAQNNDVADTGGTRRIYTFVEQMPVPRFDLTQYILKNLQYPDQARKDNIQGRVVVKFVVDTKGRVVDCTIAKGIGGACDEEALRVVQNMPRWHPGRQNGKRVKVYYTLPISFQLE